MAKTSSDSLPAKPAAETRPARVEQQTAYERWELPNVSGPHGVTAAGLQVLQQQAYNEAFEQGRSRGYEVGVSEGRTDAQAEFSSLIERLHSLLHALATPVQLLDDEMVESMATLAMTTARQLVRRELKAESGQVVAAVRQAISALPVASRHVRLYLHPDDVALIREALSLDAAETPWAVVEDPLLTRGGCRVETESSRIDATVEGRLTAVIAEVMGGARHDDSP